MDYKKYLKAAGIGALVIGAGLGGLYYGDNAEQTQIDELVAIGEAVEADLSAANMATAEANARITELEAMEPETVTETVEVEVEKIVKVDNENLGMVTDFIVEQDGNLTQLDISEVDDEGVDGLVKQIGFFLEVKDMATEEIKHELADEIDGEIIPLTDGTEMTLNEDRFEGLRINEEDMLVSEIDFPNGDANVVVTGTFEQYDVRFNFNAVVEIKDGEVDDMSVDITEA